MNYILLIATALCLALQSITRKGYSNKYTETADSSFIYSFISVIAAILVFVFTPRGDGNIDLSLIGYSTAFAVTFFCALFFNLKAISSGPLSITALINSYSLLIPIVYDMIFLKQFPDTFAWIGIILLAVSLFFIANVNNKNRFSGKWIIYVLLSFLGNGLCSTVQKIYQLQSSGANKSEFMLIALSEVAVVSLIILIAKRKNIKKEFKECAPYAALTGLFNGIVNYLMMVLVIVLPAFLLYPTVSVGSILITYIVSIIIFQEILNKNQLIGFSLGVMSVFLLNI